MCCMGTFGRRGKNKIAPVVNEPATERLEIRKDRWIRIIHYTPRSSAVCQGNRVEGNKREDVSHSPSVESTGSSQNNTNTVVIFFIHGVGGCAELWDAQLKYFHRAGYEVIAPDLLGHGASCTPREPDQYFFQEMCNDIIALFDRYSKKRNILIGHSYGSSFCTVVAAERSRMVSKVVLISGGGPIPLRPDNCHLFALPVLLLNCIEPFLACTFRRRAIHQHASRAIAKKTKAFHAPPFVLKAVMEGQLWEEGDEDFHSELMVPILLIYGAEDRFVTLQEEQWMHEAVFGSSLEVIPDAGHMVMLECPDRVNWLIHNFLQRDVSTQSQSQVNARPPRKNVSKESIRNQIKKQSEVRRATLAAQSPLFFIENKSHYDLSRKKKRSQSLTPTSHVRVETPSSPTLHVPTQEELRREGETTKTAGHSQNANAQKIELQNFTPSRKQVKINSFSSCDKIFVRPVQQQSSEVNTIQTLTNSTAQSFVLRSTSGTHKLPGINSVQLVQRNTDEEKQHELQQSTLTSSNPETDKGMSGSDKNLMVNRSLRTKWMLHEVRAASPSSPPSGTFKSHCHF